MEVWASHPGTAPNEMNQRCWLAVVKIMDISVPRQHAGSRARRQGPGPWVAQGPGLSGESWHLPPVPVMLPPVPVVLGAGRRQSKAGDSRAGASVLVVPVEPGDV